MGWSPPSCLAAAIRKLGDVELALTGDRALDTGAGEVGPRLAEALGWPHILAARTSRGQ